jgi:hypothetical protein
MALYMFRPDLRIDIEKMSATSAKAFEKHSGTYAHRGIPYPPESRYSLFYMKRLCLRYRAALENENYASGKASPLIGQHTLNLYISLRC